MQNNLKYKRIIILGGGGSGKSTLANRISLYTNYNIYYLDNLLLNSDWSEKEKSEWLEICKKEFLSKNMGIVDGNYLYGLPERIEWTDLIIFINVSTFRHLFNILKRTILVNLKLEERYGSSKDRKEKLNLKFLKHILSWNMLHRKKIFFILDSIKDKKIVITSNSRKLNIEKLLGEKIKK